MKRKRAWISGILATSACLVLAISSVASAQTLRHTDPAHDVVKMKNDGSVVAAPTNKTTDIVHVTFRHTSLRVITTMRLRDYGGSWEYYGTIGTATQQYYVLGTDSSTFFLSKAGTERPIACSGLSVTIRPAKNTLRVSIPRTCLHRPRWVRMGLAYIVDGKGGVMFSDDGLHKGGGFMSLTASRRLYSN